MYSHLAFSYPLFVTCKDNRLVDTDEISTEKTFEKLLKLSKKERELTIARWCQGSKECMGEFKQAVDLAKISYDLALKDFETKYQDLAKKLEDKFVDTKSTNALELLQLSTAVAEVKACQDTKQNLTPGDFVKNNKLLITYPYHNNYMYITGCKGVDTDTCYPMGTESVEKVIKEATIMGVDPYTVLSLSLMENEAQGVSSLYLDPIGVMASMGCQAKQVANGTEGVLNSYGTSYEVKAEVKSDPKLKAKLKKYFDEFKLGAELGNSYYCNNVQGGVPSVQEKAASGSCCIELGFKASKNASDSVARALVFPFIDQITKTPFKDKKDPSWRLQRYNGYTDLMGGAESVPAWRSGVNYYENPMYGEQAMDYMINGFMNNSWIKDKVNQYQKLYGIPESVICKGRENGTFVIDTNMYFQSQKETPRMSKIAQKIKAGGSFSSLNSREKKVLEEELRATADQNKFMHAEPKIDPGLENTISQKLGNITEIFPHGMLEEDEVLNKLKGKIKYSKDDLSRIYQGIKRATVLYSEGQKISQEFNTSYSEVGSLIQSNNVPELYQVINSLMSSDSESKTPEEIAKKVNAMVTSLDKETKEKLIKGIFKVINKKEEQMKLTEEFQKIKYPKGVSNLDFARITAAMTKYKTFEEYKTLYAEKIKADPSLEVELLKLYNYRQERINVAEMGTDLSEAAKEYFTNIYGKRSTVGQTSNYKWERLDEEQTNKLVKKYEQF